MNSRRAPDGGSVLSFTFLDVLMCTMGSLLLLLVVFGVIAKKATRARQEGEHTSISLAALDAKASPAPPRPPGPPAPEGVDADAAAAMAEQLERIRKTEAEVERMRAQAAERRRQEEERIAHLEDHERRLEHELGKLHVTLQALDAAERKQTVDQEQAEAEVVRLKEVIRDTEAQLDEMRKNARNKSYAIVPYKGANGTLRRPVFVECTADAVTIQPEGIRLTVEDFDGPLRSGNPLAAAIRAAHEELNGRARAAGETDLPDPYPLLVVRPDGAAAYAAAVDAIRSWDSDYGYEFVEADWKLQYPDSDPRLAQVMAHAVDEARQRQALLAKVAPRRYGPRLGHGAGGDGYGGGSGDGAGGGGGFSALTGSGGGNRIGAHSGDGPLGGGRDATRQANGLHSGGGSPRGNFSDEFAGGQPGAAMAAGSRTGGGGLGGPGLGGPGGTGGMGAYNSGGGAGGPASAGSQSGGSEAQATLGERYTAEGGNSATGTAQQPGGGNTAGQPGGAAGQAGTGEPGTADMAGGATASGGASAGGAGAGGSGSGGGSPTAASGATAPSANMSAGAAPSLQVGPKRASAAQTRGSNWANAAADRRTSAITRPIRCVVSADQLAILADGGGLDDAQRVTFQQSTDAVLDQLAAAVQSQVAEWGIAGDGMYWRPTLVVSVAPGAHRQAARLAELLDDSGVDVRLPQSMATNPGDPPNATR